MKAWELHDSLARSIGDPLIKIDGSLYLGDGIIPDGVRYTKAIRDQYLNRAMLMIQRDYLNKVAGLPRFKAAQILQRAFPSMTRTFRVNVEGLGMQPGDMLYVYSVAISTRYIYPYNEQAKSDIFKADPNFVDKGQVKEIPIYEQSVAYKINLRGGTIRQDLCAFVTSNGNYEWVGLLGRELDDMLSSTNLYEHTLEISYLPIAPRMENYNYDDEVEFEATYEPAIINRAILYAQFDSGEIGTPTQAVQLLEVLSGEITGGNNGNA